MPFLQGAPLPPVGNKLLFDYDFRRLTPGAVPAATLLAVTAAYRTNKRGLTFTRITNSTVQTSDTTVYPTVGANEAAIGCRDASPAHIGLVLQTRNQNTLSTDGRNFTGSGWAKNSNAFCASGPVVAPSFTTGQVGPDGTANATIITVDDWGTVNNAVGQTRPRTFSAWQKGTYQMSLTNDISACGNTIGSVAKAGTNANWGRVVVVEGPTQTTQYQIVDGRTEAAFPPPIGGSTHGPLSPTVDMAQLEQGEFATEAIISGTVSAAGMAREDDRLSYGVGSELIGSDGQIRVQFTFSPKFSTTMGGVPYAVTSTSSLTYAAYWWLLSWGSTLDDNFIRFQASDKKLHVKIAGGTEVVSTNAIAWSQFDEVVLEVTVGAGLSSVARYSINGGGWIDLVLGAVANTPAPGATPIAIMRDINVAARSGSFVDDRGQLPCWLHRLTFLNK